MSNKVTLSRMKLPNSVIMLIRCNPVLVENEGKKLV